MKLKLNRTQRQIEGLKKWAASGYNGIFQYCTGFGKTYTAIRALLGMIRKKNIQSCVVVVPTLMLKAQWEAELKKHKVKIAKVYVINTAAKKDFNVDMLILDEIHRYAAETFKEVFDNTKRKYTLGLTATLQRSDDLHKLILKHLKVVDTVTVEDALKNNWISNYMIYNVAVDFSIEDEIAYNKANTTFRYFASQLGGKYDAFATAKTWINSDDDKEKGIAAAYYNVMRKRKSICTNNPNKVKVVKKIINKFDKRNGLIFNPSIKFANSIQKLLGDIAASFHSSLHKKEQKEIIKKFKDKRTKLRYLSTVKALNEGFDVPECSVGIITGASSSKIAFIQQLGRIIRFVEGKKATMINLYTPNTQEEVWMKKKQADIEQSRIENCTVNELLIKLEK